MRRIIQDLNIDFIGKAKWAFVISLLIIVYSFYLWFNLGDAKFGVDYKGGAEIIVKGNENTTSEKIRKALASRGIKNAVVQSFEKESFEFSIKLAVSADVVEKEVEKVIKQELPEIEVIRTDIVGPTIGAELRRNALKAVIFGLIGILLYISIRFEFAFALGAVVALFHDVIVCTGVYLMSGRQISAATLAAALTIVGYSVNDTIVIFDRCREELLKLKKFNLVDVMNKSINATLSRTIITSLLTLFSALALLLYGGGAIADLSLYLVVGIITGTYSTIYIASPVVIYWHKYTESREKKK